MVGQGKGTAKEDREFVEQVLAGQEEAFACLYDKYKKSLFRTALAITEDQGAAEEILQDTFVRAYRHLQHVDLSQPLGAWLQRIAVNLSYNWAKSHRFWPVSLEEMIDRLVAGPQASPEEVLERSELRRRVRQALRVLNLEQRLVVILFYLQGFRLAEIAYILECPVGTVKSRLYHARRILRQELGPEIVLAPQPVLDAT